MKPSVMFLLGSGISIPAGFPSTVKITNQIFEGNNIIRHTDSRYYFSENVSPLEDFETKRYLPDVLSLLEVINELMVSYDKKEILNYEMLFYYIQQLHTYESGDLFNLALYPFIRQVEDKFRQKGTKIKRYIEIYSEAENYIRNSVWHLLSKPTNNNKHLEFLLHFIQDKEIDKANIATLNHDLLIEKYFDEQQITYHDGFGLPIKGVRYWKNDFSDTQNVLKIHGSVNWVSLRPDYGDWFDEKVGIVLDGDIDHPLSPDGIMMRSMPEREPQILIGTYNKINEYTESLFSDIYSKFRSLLNSSSQMVISGYSFGDKGINTAILEWLYQNRSHKIIVIHRKPDDLLKNQARVAIRKAYTDMARNNFILIHKHIQDTSWKEIKEAIIKK